MFFLMFLHLQIKFEDKKNYGKKNEKKNFFEHKNQI